jgi:hypothetical protein
VALACTKGRRHRSLIAIARDHAVSKMRSDALFWLGQRAGAQAVSAIAEAIERDPDTEAEKAVFALSQLPKDVAFQN